MALIGHWVGSGTANSSLLADVVANLAGCEGEATRVHSRAMMAYSGFRRS